MSSCRFLQDRKGYPRVRKWIREQRRIGCEKTSNWIRKRCWCGLTSALVSMRTPIRCSIYRCWDLFRFPWIRKEVTSYIKKRKIMPWEKGNPHSLRKRCKPSRCWVNQFQVDESVEEPEAAEVKDDSINEVRKSHSKAKFPGFDKVFEWNCQEITWFTP